MAVSITQQPTSPNSAYTDLIYVVSGSGTTGNPQYSYIMDVYLSGSSNLIYRSLQVPNGDNAGVFNPSKIFQGEISLKTDLFTGSLPYFDTLTHKTFDVKFGEAYGTSVSSSITYYPNLTSSSIAVWPSTVDPYSGSYNFPSQSYDPAYIENVLNGAGAFCITSRNVEPWINPSSGVGNVEFTNRPVTNDDYLSLALLKTKNYSLEDISPPADFLVTVVFEDSPTLELWSVDFTINTDLNTEGIIYVPIGPKSLVNLPDIGLIQGLTFAQAFARPWRSVSFNFIAFINPPFFDPNSQFNNRYYNAYSTIAQKSFSSFTIPPYGKTLFPVYNNCNQRLNFAFLTEAGVVEYQNIFGQFKRNTTLERENVTLPVVDYSSPISTYDITRRGQLEYFTDYMDNYSITTEPLNEDNARWVQQILLSPQVFVQQEDGFVPIIITNSSYTVNTDQYRQKNFQYTITFKPAKGRNITPYTI